MHLEVKTDGTKTVRANKTELRRLREACPVLAAYHACTNSTVAVEAQSAIEKVLASLNGEHAEAASQESETKEESSEDDTEAEAGIHATNGFSELLTRYANLEREKRKLNDRLKEISAEMATIGPPLCNEMTQQNMQRATVGDLTIYLKKNRFIGRQEGIGADVACEVLERFGWGYLVKENYNANSLKSKVVEMLDDEGQQLPEGFDDYFKIHEEVVVAVRSA